MTFPTARRCVLTLALVCCRSLAAQQPDSSAQHDTAAMSVRRHPLPPVVITGSLAPSDPEWVGVARATVGAAEIRAEPVRAMTDELRRTPGLFIDEAAGAYGPTIIRLRGGEEEYTQVLIDGVPVNENGGFFDAQGLTMVGIDHLDVTRGPQSTIYGSSAMSGVIQMFSAQGQPGPMRTDALFEGGRATAYNGSLRAAFDASGGSDATRYAFGVGSSYDRGPYALPSNLHSNDASARFDFVPDEHWLITTSTRFMGVHAMQPVRDRGVTRAPLDPNQAQGRERTLGVVDAVWTPSTRWTHRWSLSHYYLNFTYDDQKVGLDETQFDSFVPDATINYRSIVQRTIGRYVGTVTGQPERGLGLSFSYGGEWERETLNADQRSPDYGNDTSYFQRPSVSGFAEAQARIGQRLSLLAGSRIEKYRGLASEAVPRATAVFDLIPGHVALRTAVGRAYHAPNIQDQYPANSFFVANPDLKPETSTSWEAGTNLSMTPWNATAAVTYFNQEFENLIRSVNYDSAGTKQINRNLGRSRAAGVEAEVGLHPLTRWTLGAEGAWTATRILDNNGLPADEFPNGEPLPFRPAYTGSVYVDAPLAAATTLAARVTGIGRQTVLANRYSGARVSVAPYSLVGFTLSQTLSADTDTYLELNNLLNRTYDVAYDRPGLPRTAVVGFRVHR